MSEFQLDIRAWALNLTSEVDLEWKNHQELASRGYAVFYSPPVVDPELMVIGFNPAGQEGVFNLDTRLSLPEKHDYFNPKPYRIARVMRELFDWNSAT